PAVGPRQTQPARGTLPSTGVRTAGFVPDDVDSSPVATTVAVMPQSGFAQSIENPESPKEFCGMRHVAVIGSGAMGTACAILLADQIPQVTLWGRDPENMRQMAISRENSRQLPGTPLPTNLSVTADCR